MTAMAWAPFVLVVLTRISAALIAVLWVEGQTLAIMPAFLRTVIIYGALALLGQAFARHALSGFFARPVPDMRVVSHTGSFFAEAVVFAACGMQGWRDAMEDAHICEILDPDLFPDIVLLAVLDGHGGKDVSLLASRLLAQEVRGCAKKQVAFANGKKPSNGVKHSACVQLALEDALPRLDASLRSGCWGLARLLPMAMHPFSSMGSTACVVALDVAKREVVCANVGDSRAFVIKNGKAVALSEDHKPENTEERSRIVAAGGQVVKVGPCHRVDGNLNLSRALGDFYLKANPAVPPAKQKVIAVPDSQRNTFKGGAQELLVVACDGLFEKRSNQEVADLIWPRVKSGMALEQIGREVLKACCARECRGRPIEEGTDNETIILVKLAPQPTAGEVLCPGRRVQIHGLESEAGQLLNGQVGIIEGPANDNRFEIRLLASSEVKSFKAANLVVTDKSDTH